MTFNKYDTSGVGSDYAVLADPIVVINSSMHISERPWHYPFLMCCRDCDSCLEAHCCFYCQLSRQYSMLYSLQPEIHWPLCLCTAFWNMTFGNVVSCLMILSLRSDMRRRYGIEGGLCRDCVAAYLCPSCALQQQLLEMTSLGSYPGAFCYSNVPAEPQLML